MGYGGWFGALLSANANNGTNAGFGYLNTNNRSSNSNANIGFRLYRSLKNILQYIQPPIPYLTRAVGTLAAGKRIMFWNSVSKQLKTLF